MREENYTYDHLGRVTQVQKKIYNVTYTTSCAYNLACEVTTMTYPLPTLLDLVKDIISSLVAKAEEFSYSPIIDCSLQFIYRAYP